MIRQRPTDRDEEVDSDDLADSLSELPEARLVAAPGRAREVLASDAPRPPASPNRSVAGRPLDSSIPSGADEQGGGAVPGPPIDVQKNAMRHHR